MADTLHKNYIGGAWRAGVDTTDNRNPSDLGDSLGAFAQADAAQTREAIDAARHAQPAWAQAGLEARYTALLAIGTELMARAEALGRELSREEGKPLAEGKGEVYRAGQFFHYYAAEVHRQIGDVADSVRPGIEVLAQREPVGVVGVISPWNFPIATAAWKIAPALAFGNAVVWKPANLVPASAWYFAEIVSRQNLPAGVFNLVMGRGSEVGDTLVSAPDIDAITFTGSVETGRRVGLRAMQNLTRVQMEMGSKNPLVVLDDADVDTAVQCAFVGGYSGSGQKCTASSRLIVADGIHDRFVEALSERLAAARVGHALDPSTAIGPVVDAGQLQSDLDWIETARREGAEIAVGGSVASADTEGYFLQPTLFTGTRNDMRINQEEMFGPMASVIRVSDAHEALQVANDTRFGLTAGIVTESLSAANHFRRQARFGCTMVNLPTAGTDYHVPFGGRGESSYGPREQGQYAREFYTQVKTSYVRIGEP
ncbi:aldehyde dehydrogenase family protein [Spiribacter roseus]|uniref:Aldehyde dehydrogenase family protein n=1 Tax=Spiribacter roseus TaxID=1855875 RepID=A0ABV3RYQ0_9GAMM